MKNNYVHNNNHEPIKKGQVRWCEFPKGNNALLGGKRPGVILSNDIANQGSGSIIVCPCTTKVKRKLPVHIELTDNTAMLEEITVLPRESVHDVIYELDWKQKRDIDTAILIEFGII